MGRRLTMGRQNSHTDKTMPNVPTIDAHMGDATYDPDDNKLRLRAYSRLDSEDYARAKAVGFRWAPRQELFFAVWSPAAAALLEEWCGEIGDEDTSLADRAAERADRFDDYSAKRERDGDVAHAASRELAGGIPMGQPILVGHHSEKRARKDAEKIERSLERAVKMWETAEYWQRRAAGVVSNAAYKDRPEVRARRIKTLEAEARKRRAEFEPQKGPDGTRDPFPMVAWRSKTGAPEPHVMTGQGRAKCPTPVACLEAAERRERPWLEHIERRLTYERAILETQGATELLKPKKRAKLAPLLNIDSPGGMKGINRYRSDEIETLPQVRMTKAEWKDIWSDYKGSRYAPGKAYRFRTTVKGHSIVAVFLTDSKVHEVPA